MALDDTSQIEREIITEVLNRIDALGAENETLNVWIFDGEEWSYKTTLSQKYDRAEAEKVIAITDFTIIRVSVNADYTQLHFYHGNEEDVLSDVMTSRDGQWLEDRLTNNLPHTGL